ncbi:hypothetical protein CDAR_320641 [Caerostris darwini]|uniref:Uncharacterized protein n=1 Tax=Caerostris darwini TaxID=1538125 RepID=A0AAV4WY57_9ARAC|nr:hypothetical protein CDAR_320641 [Caerostris darwini]
MVLWINNNGEKIALEGRGEEKNSHYLLLARPLLSGDSSCFLISLSSPGMMVEDSSAEVSGILCLGLGSKIMQAGSAECRQKIMI